MTYDFDEPVDRRGTDSMKWDLPGEEIPMWVADMDFKTAPEIRDALERRVDHGVFGYTVVPERWSGAYRAWWGGRHSFDMEGEWLAFSSGVVPAVSSAVRKLTTVAEKVLIQSPVYNIFYNSIVNNGRRVLESPLRCEDGGYRIDFDDLEEKLRDPQTTLMILCNPHNPVGRIWSREELGRIGDLCAENGVIVLSDEIHCDLTDPGFDYVPFASVSEACRENSVTCLSPSKSFNLAGLQSAAVAVANPRLRAKVVRGLNTDEIAEPNAFAVDAAVAAFNRGGAWLDALREYLFANKSAVRSFLASRLPGLIAVPSRATYLLWLDCRPVADDVRALQRHLRKNAGLYLSEGSGYGSGGEGFLRMNIACPRRVVDEALVRLERGIREFRGD